ncbi:MAG TPA: hypothetical protein VHR45_01090 [Thermoanaerobaculia bacterium]|nr:hypothetical protein [Thermoanaerobaculia bacterium]
MPPHPARRPKFAPGRSTAAAARQARPRGRGPAGRLPVPLALVLAALAPLLAYWPATSHSFLLDDFVLFQTSPSLSDLGSIPKGFLTDVGALRKGAGTVISSYYRPVFLALSTLYHRAAGGNPFAWHAASAALAALIGALVCAFLLRLGISPLAALLAAAVFSLHPSHVSSVAWASGLQELLAAFFVCCALHAALWREDADRDALPAGLAGLAFTLALLSKEVAIGLLPFVAIWALGTARSDPRRSRRLRKVALVLAGVTLLYLAVRIVVLGGLAIPAPNAPGLVQSLPAVPVAFVTYLRLLVWPTGFAFFRPERPSFGPFAAPVLLAVALSEGLAVLAAWAIRKRRELLLPVAWLVVWLLPVLNLWALDPQWMVTDRYLFLPSLALPWIVALLVPRRLAAVLLALLAGAYALLTVRYSAIFQDQHTFLAAMERAEPTSPTVFAEKGRLLAQEGRLAAAQAALARAVALDPIAPGALLALGDLELQRGDLAAAEIHYRQALIVRPYASRPFKLLAIAWGRAGRRQKAFSLSEEAARRWPQDFEAQLLHALFLGAAGERPEAEAAFAAARRLRPLDPALAGGLDAALARLLPTLLPGR